MGQAELSDRNVVWATHVPGPLSWKNHFSFSLDSIWIFFLSHIRNYHNWHSSYHRDAHWMFRPFICCMQVQFLPKLRKGLLSYGINTFKPVWVNDKWNMASILWASWVQESTASGASGCDTLAPRLTTRAVEDSRLNISDLHYNPQDFLVFILFKL